MQRRETKQQSYGGIEADLHRHIFLSHYHEISRNFELFDLHGVGKITVEPQGRVNDCQARTYRQDIKVKDIEKYTTFKLPTRQWGYVVISTPDGILDHGEAIRRNVGGQVLGYFH
ncbi:hypothetical protein ES332_D08G304000v1 [Gossypium tomentosum]|uniref:Ribosomal protein S8 n=1 Tax=Gossypium tomentosum TaxID=34277 RepID=A0A5D2K1F9_GOSTO|nr:hypothetical protein ES332_D08G304000v1 [Gossypium tomentosum]